MPKSEQEYEWHECSCCWYGEGDNEERGNCRACNPKKLCYTPSFPCPTPPPSPAIKAIESPSHSQIRQPTDLFFPIEIIPELGTPAFEIEKPWLTIQRNDKYEEEENDPWFSKANPPPAVLGCMDPTANNYNPLATQDDGSCTYNPPPSQPTHYTPAYSRDTRTGKQAIEQATIISQATGPSSVVSQDPDGIKWVAPSSWVAAQWDGIPLNTTGMIKGDICAWLIGPNTVKGLRERFYEVNPFADNTNPTVKEIENWNLEVIRHFRRLLGVTTPVRHNAKLYLECAWSDERKGTEVWDTDYPGPGPIGSAEGPCDINNFTVAASHCGDSFFPNSIDRGLHISEAPYNNDFVAYPELSNYTSRYSQAVGLASVNTNIPWSIKFARIIYAWICSEGLSGHPGPYVGAGAREEFGCSWFISKTNPNSTGFRGKWH